MVERSTGHLIECEVAVVGAGPAGIAAATVAAEAGREVVLLDAGLRPGGQIWRHRTRSELTAQAVHWLERLDRSAARVIYQSTVVDARVRGSGGIELTLEREGETVTVRAGRVVLATGARELFLPFPGWTLPNIFGVGGGQALLKSGASFSGKRVVIAGSGPLLLAVAASFRQHGARVVIVAEQASRSAVFRFGAGLWRSPGRIIQAAGLRAALGSTRFAPGTWVSAATGDEVVREVTLTDGRKSWTERCDILCTGYGLVPNTELAEVLGCAVAGRGVQVDEWQRTTVAGVYCAGEPTGIAGVDAALLEGEIAARHAVGDTAEQKRLFSLRRREHEFSDRLERTFALRPELRALPRPGTIICRCEDISLDQLDPDWSFRQAKLYTRIGMGPCQARVCGPAHRFLFGGDAETGRVPALPTAVSTLVGAPPTADGAVDDS
jgi:NADPH-dependent 2,4-dienoyl-CoA reductase/sulfur reductase-like enzyme